jgi:hypothetical protein
MLFHALRSLVFGCENVIFFPLIFSVVELKFIDLWWVSFKFSSVLYCYLWFPFIRCCLIAQKVWSLMVSVEIFELVGFFYCV